MSRDSGAFSSGAGGKKIFEPNRIYVPKRKLWFSVHSLAAGCAAPIIGRCLTSPLRAAHERWHFIVYIGVQIAFMIFLSLDEDATRLLDDPAQAGCQFSTTSQSPKQSVRLKLFEPFVYYYVRPKKEGVIFRTPASGGVCRANQRALFDITSSCGIGARSSSSIGVQIWFIIFLEGLASR